MNVLLFKLFADAYSSEHIALLRLCAGAALSGALLARALLLVSSSQKPYCAYHIQSENYIFAYTLQFYQISKSALFSTIFFPNLKSTMTTPPVEHATVIISEPNLPTTEQKFQHAVNSPISRMPRISPTVSPSPTAVQLANQSGSSASGTPSAVSEGQDGMIAKLLEHLQQQQQNQQVQQQGETSSFKL